MGLARFFLFLFVAFIGTSLADNSRLQEKSNLNIVFYIIGILFFADILGFNFITITQEFLLPLTFIRGILK